MSDTAPLYVGHDLGTGCDKAVLVDGAGRVLRSYVSRFALHHPHPGWAEQSPEDWWAAVCEGTRSVAAGVEARIRSITFAGQMLALVPMTATGEPSRPALSWLDHRAEHQARRLARRFGGAAVVRRIAGAAPTGKDLLPKMAWLAEHEPGTMSRTAAFGDATSFLVARATGRVALDPTAAGATGMFDPRRRRWSRGLARLSGMPLDRMPPIVECAQTAGGLTAAAAQALGLRTGTPVAMGMADIPAAALGSGATRPGDAHVYLGTSAWIAMTLTRPRNVPRAGIVSVAHPEPGACLLIAESETAGACRDWATDHLEVDHAGLDALAAGSPPGARGLLFCPWLFGERSPVPDSGLRGGLLNLSLGHTRADTARAVLEGVALNLRWILDAVDGATGRRGPLRAIGGGAQSDLWLQILADILAQPIERVGDSRFAGALGAALCGAVAVGDLASLRAIRDRIHVDRTFVPDPAAAPATNRALAALRQAAAPLSRIAGLLRHEGVA